MSKAWVAEIPAGAQADAVAVVGRRQGSTAARQPRLFAPPGLLPGFLQTSGSGGGSAAFSVCDACGLHHICV